MAARAHMKDPAHRTKVVLRRLPPAIAQQAVVDQVDARFAGRYDWACFRPGNARRVSGVLNKQYVARDSGKEKPTYIMVPKREEHTQREKAVAGSSDATSGGTSGPGQAVEAKRDKIIILKGRGRVDSNTPDGTLTPVKNVLPSSSRQDQRLEAGGRIIKTILSNKEVRSSNPSQHEQEGHMLNTERDKRPPRVLNPRTIVKDHIVENAERSHFDEKPNHLHGSAPVGEKIERHARNRDRPDRGVWAPRRYDKSTSGGGSHASSSEFPQMQSYSGDNLSQLADGHGDRKTDTRSHGGSRGGPVENGHRHINRRGPRGPKETEISASLSDAKNPKRGSASYGAHERQVWVQKSSSGS
nr:unnamed protein product [Digitaria exilis]